MSHIYRIEVLVYLCLNNATAKLSLGSSFDKSGKFGYQENRS